MYEIYISCSTNLNLISRKIWCSLCYRVTQKKICYFIQMVMALKICILDLMLVEPKCVWVIQVYFRFSAVCLQILALCYRFLKIWSTKTHFGSTNMGSNMHIFVLWPFDVANFDLGHPVFKVRIIICLQCKWLPSSKKCLPPCCVNFITMCAWLFLWKLHFTKWMTKS